jgi:polyphenol oxidase
LELSRAFIPAGLEESLVAAFPGPAAEGESLALLSLASSGDMKFGSPDSLPRRELFLRSLGLEGCSCVGLHLAHSRNVIFPDRPEEAELLAAALGGADGILLRDPSLAASVTVADCMPIWLLDRDSGAFGVLHSGWRGTGILGRAVSLLAERYGSRPSALSVILGPAIGSCCYAVPEERAEAFAAEFGPAAVARREGQVFLDLRSANLSLAERAGVGSLLSIEACTSCDSRLGSYRRQGPASFTRMLALCARLSRAPNIVPGAISS